MKKFKVTIVSTVVALSVLIAPAARSQINLNADEVLYHNTFPLSSSPTYDTFVTNTEYANTVIMSNTIAGVMYYYLIKQKYPKMKINKDYLIGSLMGQLMQESDITTQINNNFKPDDPEQLINNSTYANILLSKGQGGPYQINDYSKRLPSVGQTGALGLVNYNTVAKELGYSIEAQDNGTQTNKQGPLALDNIYSGPMITTFYHFNDINRMNVNASNSWFQYKDLWNKCIEVSQTDEAIGRGLSFPVVMNVVYNAGSYSPVLKSYLNICANPQEKKLYNNMNNWNLNTLDYQTAIGADKPSKGDATYYRYPRQVSYYLQQMYNNNNTKLKKTGLTVNNDVKFSVARLKQVFGMIMHKLSFRNSKKELQYIPEQYALAAFDKAAKGKLVTSLSFSNTRTGGNSQRLIIYNIINKAIVNLAIAYNFNFAETYNGVSPSPTPVVPEYAYPDGIGKYVKGTAVSAGDSVYICKEANWCNIPTYTPLGSFSTSAWTNNNPPAPPKPIGTWDPSKAYSEGDTVEIDGDKYEAQWWNKDVNPVEHHTKYQDPWNQYL